jgi:hypothetical protein
VKNVFSHAPLKWRRDAVVKRPQVCSHQREEAVGKYQISNLKFQIKDPLPRVGDYDVNALCSLPIDVSGLYSLIPAYTRLNLKIFPLGPSRVTKKLKAIKGY